MVAAAPRSELPARKTVLPQSNLEERSVWVSITCTEVSTMSDKQPRRHFSPQEKATIIKRHLLEGAAISALCDEFHIKPSLFYQWQRQLFENAPLAFDNGRQNKAQMDGKDQKIEQLEAKLVRKNEVMAEIMEAYTLLKKNLGEL
jgi:transposase-like protein